MALWCFTEAVLRARPLLLQLNNHGAMQRDFIYIDDIVDGVVGALDRPLADDGSIRPGGSPAAHALYNLGNDLSAVLRTLFELVETECGQAAIAELLSIQRGNVVATWAEIAASRCDLGFAPSVNLAESGPRSVDWYRGYAGL
jgi:UDP-glucuronate 4-epimerase